MVCLLINGDVFTRQFHALSSYLEPFSRHTLFSLSCSNVTIFFFSLFFLWSNSLNACIHLEALFLFFIANNNYTDYMIRVFRLNVDDEIQCARTCMHALYEC